ncbi:hypothetical protein T4E_3250 [Trichinella pseudospiralis]|uniref:Uncharacterized protein n=1 Tax=Trichinella pseudospiralis TaxID=6337 RepID=A0A0V0Y208_TRIPS|nr:hypothetical protein T4E_3250 [Trichinella pseudospiralis]
MQGVSTVEVGTEQQLQLSNSCETSATVHNNRWGVDGIQILVCECHTSLLHRSIKPRHLNSITFASVSVIFSKVLIAFCGSNKCLYVPFGDGSFPEALVKFMHGCRLLKFSNCFKFISQQLHAVAAEKQPEALEFRAKKTHLAIFILLPYI